MKRSVLALHRGLESDRRADELRLRAKKACVEAWIREAVAGDAALGRGDAQWAAPPAAALRPQLAAMKARGLTVYAGSGQLLVADISPDAPRLIQRRPLAQRQVRLEIPEDLHAESDR